MTPLFILFGFLGLMLWLFSFFVNETSIFEKISFDTSTKTKALLLFIRFQFAPIILIAGILYGIFVVIPVGLYTWWKDLPDK